MSRFKDETNKVHQTFKVISLADSSFQTKGRNTIWRCVCLICGDIKNIRGDRLRAGKSLRCLVCNPYKTVKHAPPIPGKVQGKDVPMHNFIDEIGNRYGNLVVISRAENYREKSASWNCICDCGNTTVAIGSQLRRGATKHCGCKRIVSIGEVNIYKFLQKKFGKNSNAQIIPEYSFSNLLGRNNFPLRFDFAILINNSVKGLIEYNGEQHYTAVPYWGGEYRLNYIQEHDKSKEEYCRINNYPLLIVPYTEKNIVKVLDDFCNSLGQ